MTLILLPTWSVVSGGGDWLIRAVVLSTVLWVLIWAASRASRISGRGRSGPR